MKASRKPQAGRDQPAPALIRQGIYTALGGALLAGGAAVVLLVLNPPPKVVKTAAGGCGCTSGAATTAKVYG